MSIENPVLALQETDLWKYLESINREYAERSIAFLVGITPLMGSIVEYFPYYTRHDVGHGVEVVKRIGQILYSECLEAGNDKSLNPQEAFLLIASAYSHDVGMAVFPGEEEELRLKYGLQHDDNWKTNSSLTKYLRDNHSVRGMKFIQDNAMTLKVPQNLVSILGDMMRSHNLQIHELEVQLGKRAAAGQQEIDIKQLACILCIADALEFSDTRVIDGVIEKLKNDTSVEARISYRENMKHICIGDSVAIGDDGRVIFWGTFNEPEVMALAHRTIDLTEDWIRQYCDIESTAIKKRLRIKGDQFIRNLNLPNYDYERLGIRMKKENIINLIASNSTWSNNPAVPLRELLQNSVEACRYREYQTPASRNYEPKISVVFNRQNRQIIVEDNGCGMSKNVILNNFLTVGNSRSDNPTYASHGYSSLARFGIGFWSLFTIASDVIVETAPFETLNIEQDMDESIQGLTFSVNIDEFRDYTVFAPIVRQPGTSIKFNLKDNIEMDAIVNLIRGQVTCSQIPIKISVIDEQEIDIPQNPISLDLFDLYDSHSATAIANNVEVYQWQTCEDGVEVALSISYRKAGGKATFLLEDKKNSLLNILPRINQYTVSVCGFTVPLSIDPLCLDLKRVGTVSVNIKSPKGLKFSLDRRTLLPSPDQVIVKNIANKVIHDGYRQFLKDNNSYSDEQIYNLNQESRLHGGEVYDSYTSNSLTIAQENYPDLLGFKFIEVRKGQELKNSNSNFTNLSNIHTMDSNKIFVCQHYKFNDNRYRSVEPMLLIPTLYNYISRKFESLDQLYIAEPNFESSLLFDNSDDSKLHVWQALTPLGFIDLYVIELTTNLNLSAQHPWVIAKVTGKWSGTVYEREIISDQNKQFLFLGRYRLVVKSESRLAQTIRQLNSEGKTFAIVELITKLEDIDNGHYDGEFLKAWPELI